MGLEQAGMEVVYQCEIEKKCQSVLKRHWPDVPLHDDVSTLTGKMVLDAVGSIDVVAWGSPCQDLSVAGGRSGLEGNKSGLFHEGIRIIKELREESNNESPRWSIWENVRGAFSSNHGRDFATVIDQMGEAGAVEIEWRLLDAQYFGVPQRRKRIFVVAGFHPRADNADPVFALTESVRRNPSTSDQEREEIAGTLGLGFGNGGSDIDEMTFIPPIATAVCARYAKGPGPTVDPGQVLVTPAVRRITPRECERLMGWPDNHTLLGSDGKKITDGHRYKMCGNGVVSSVAKWVGEQVMRATEEAAQPEMELF